MGLLVVALVTMAVFALVGALPDPRKVRRALAQTRPTRIGELGDGAAATVRGTIEDVGDVLWAPLSNRACVYWLIMFDEIDARENDGELGHAESGGSFMLRDESGSARVVPDHPRIALVGVSFDRTITQLEANTELARPVCRPPTHRSGRVRATEYVLEPGFEITISGWCTREPDPEAVADVSGYREQLPVRAVISGSRQERMMIG